MEFEKRSIPYQQQPSFPILYKEVKIGEYIPDLIAYGKLIIDTKTIERITDIEIGQMMNYLSITGLNIGLIMNFKHAKLDWKRVINTR